MRSVSIEAFAKINLTLRVVGKRTDGFHEVQTVLQTIDLSDRIVCVSQRGTLRLRCRADGVPDDRTNLVWRAAEALWRADGRSGEPRDLEIVVTKRIPARAGLGGGSSDAAATLMALTRLWNLEISYQTLAHLAATLGSDVPFFLWGGAALGVGRGDEIYPLADLPRWWALIITPSFGISTADAYGWRDGSFLNGGDSSIPPRHPSAGGAPGTPPRHPSADAAPGTPPGASLFEWRGPLPRQAGSLVGPQVPHVARRTHSRSALVPLCASIDPRLDGTWLGRLPTLGNDLEAPVARHHPEIARTIAALRQHGALVAAMSGSGSSMFGLFASDRAAKTARRQVRLAARWSARIVRLLPRDEFVRRARPVLAARQPLV